MEPEATIQEAANIHDIYGVNMNTRRAGKNKRVHVNIYQIYMTGRSVYPYAEPPAPIRQEAR
jgi:hypothetical protein